MENLNLKKNRGIEKMKKTKMILIVTLGICMLSFMPVVVGKADSRPIEDFTATNAYVAAWLDPESGLTIFPHGFWVTPSGLETIADCEYHGSILERDLKDGRILYKVNLHVKGAWMLVGNSTDLLFAGVMDYTFTATMILYEGVFGGPVPNILQIWFADALGLEPIGEGTFSHITGRGTGTFLLDAEVAGQSFIAGDTAKVNVIQVGFTKPEGHPLYPEMWPVELVFFH